MAALVVDRCRSISSRRSPSFLRRQRSDRAARRATPTSRRRRMQLHRRRRRRLWPFRPHVYGYELTRRPGDAGARSSCPIRTQDRTDRLLRARASATSCSGLIPTRPAPDRAARPARAAVFSLGADRLGRDMFSRIIYGARISMSIGLVGVSLSACSSASCSAASPAITAAGSTSSIQRVIEFLLRAADDPALAGARRGAAAGLAAAAHLFHDHHHPVADRLDAARARRARPVPVAARRGFRHRRRGSTAAPKDGIIFRHMLPCFISHIIASVTLAIPAMILAETSLSFLGLGLQPPIDLAGACCCRRRRTSARSPRRPGCSRPASRWSRGAGAQLPGRRPARRRRSLYK